MEQQHGRPDDRTHPHESHGRHRPAEGHGHAPGHGHHKSAPPVDPASVPAGTQWTCPMHPEIVRDGPGSCPICGMDLVPMDADTDEEDKTYKSYCGSLKWLRVSRSLSSSSLCRRCFQTIPCLS